jgi:LysM repeat protein
VDKARATIILEEDMSTIHKLTIIVLIAAVLAVGMGFRAQPALAASCNRYYTVRWGDTLAEIARDFGTTVQRLVKINGINNPSKIYAGQRLCVSKGSDSSTGVRTGTFPTFSIVKVVKNEDVTIQVINLPRNDTYKVTMGEMGTRGVGGYNAGSFNSGNGGTKKYTFDIPSQLRGERQIAIRIQSSKTGFFAYNWFYNNTSSGGGGTGGGTTPTTGYKGIPTFRITAVVRNEDVSIHTNNFPKNVRFDVYMNYMGTQGIGGWYVETINSGDGGAFNDTYDIPSQLRGESRIAIRLVARSGGYFAYNWFWNNTYP